MRLRWRQSWGTDAGEDRGAAAGSRCWSAAAGAPRLPSSGTEIAHSRGRRLLPHPPRGPAPAPRRSIGSQCIRSSNSEHEEPSPSTNVQSNYRARPDLIGRDCLLVRLRLGAIAAAAADTAATDSRVRGRSRIRRRRLFQISLLVCRRNAVQQACELRFYILAWASEVQFSQHHVDKPAEQRFALGASTIGRSPVALLGGMRVVIVL